MNTPNETPTGTLTEKEGNELFYKAFSEISGEEHKPSTYNTESTPVVTEALETPDTEKPETPVEKVAPAATEVEAAEPAKSTTTPPAATQAPAPTIEELLEQFPEDKRAFVQQLIVDRNLYDQKFKSHQGRLAAERKQRISAEQELIKLRGRGASSPPDPALAAQSKVDHAKAIDEWKQVVEAEPTLAKAIDALTDAKTRDVETKLRAEMTSEQEARQFQATEEAKAREWSLVVDAVPNVTDVIRSPAFQYWKDNIAPPGIRQLAENSVDHRDALFVLHEYTPYAMWVNKQEDIRAGVHQPATTATSAVEADKISAQRARKASPVVPGAAISPNVTPEVGNTFDEITADRLFAEAWAKIKK